MLTLSVSSTELPLRQVNDTADSVLAQKISQVSGVGLVTLNGSQKPAVRVQVDPVALAGTGLSIDDVRLAIVAANVNQPKGNIDGPRQDYTIATNDQLANAAAFKPIVVAYVNGAAVRLVDVANVVDGVENEQLAAWAGDRRAIILNVQRQPGANVIQVADRVKALLPQLKASLPQSIEVSILSDRTRRSAPRCTTSRSRWSSPSCSSFSSSSRSCAMCARPSSRASRFHSRSSARSASCTCSGTA